MPAFQLLHCKLQDVCKLERLHGAASRAADVCAKLLNQSIENFAALLKATHPGLFAQVAADETSIDAELKVFEEALADIARNSTLQPSVKDSFGIIASRVAVLKFQ